MSKEKSRGHKEKKKPKKEQPKVHATANSGAAKAQPTIGGQKVK